MNNMGKRIKELRKKNDLTQEKLAALLGVTDKAVSKWECSLTYPDLGLIIPLSRVLNVSADELLSGKAAEVDERRAEFDKHSDNWSEYCSEESYLMALRATEEYPRDYKYLVWLAHTEMNIAYNSKYKKDFEEYSDEMLKKSIEHNNIVIEECQDSKIKETAIWNSMLCCKRLNQLDEAKKYAEMFPSITPITRSRAMEICLDGKELFEHYKGEADSDLQRICISLSRIYRCDDAPITHVEAALDATEAILKAVIHDENYLRFNAYLCCVYQRRAELAITAGDYDMAMEYLRIMMDIGKKVPENNWRYTCGVLDGLEVRSSGNNHLPYVLVGCDDISKPIAEQLRNRIKTLDVFSPLRSREDYSELFE